MVNYIEPLKGDFSERVPSEQATQELVAAAQFMRRRAEYGQYPLSADAANLLELQEKDPRLIAFGLRRVRRETLNRAIDRLLEQTLAEDSDYETDASTNSPDAKSPTP